MGPPLKGKKAWRKHLDSTEVEQFLEDASHQARRGPNVESLKDSDLFFIDKGADVAAAEDAAAGRRKRKPRDTQLHLRSTAILQQASSAQPVLVQKPVRKVNPVIKKPEAQPNARRPRFAPVAAAELDIWNQDTADCSAAASWAPEPTSMNLLHKLGAKAGLGRPLDRNLPSRVKAVEVDMAGCSYNPDHEEHQDALAVLVASEMKLQLQQELAPKAPPRLVDLQPGEEVLDEITRLQVEATQDEDENEIPLSDLDEDEDDGAAVARRGKGEKKTQKDRNRDKRRLSQEKEQAERRLLKRQRQDLEQLGQLQESMVEELEQQGLKRQRRQTVKEEKAATLPARLGRHKFELPSVQVATTEELGGSLRRVKPCPMVALHRYKSLQHRGLIEPRKPVVARTGKKIFYEKGLRTEKAVAAQAEIEDIQKKRKLATKKTKKAKKAARAKVL